MDNAKANTPPASRWGPSRGSVTRRKVEIAPAPRLAAASSSALDTWASPAAAERTTNGSRRTA